jgi:hypothetical protein
MGQRVKFELVSLFPAIVGYAVFPFAVMQAILAESAWIDSTADVRRSRIILARNIADDITNSFDVLLLRIAGDSFVKSPI